MTNKKVKPIIKYEIINFFMSILNLANNGPVIR